MSVQRSTSSTPINQVDQTLVSQENVSGVKEHKPPVFLKTISNKLKTGFNNLVLSHNKRVVARAYVKQEVEKNIKQFGGNGWVKANIRLFQKRNYKKDIATNFNTKALDLNFVKTLKGKDLKAFFKVFKSELLKNGNKAIFKELQPKAQKAFIEQNKGDVEFLSTFSNVYKEELKCVVEWNRTTNVETKNIPELFTVFKDAIISNKDQIIKDPTILAYADKATLESIIEPIIKGDEELGKALIQSFFSIDGAFVEKALTAEIKETDQSTFSSMETIEKNLLMLFKNEAPQPDYTLGESIQLFSDAARGYEFTFKGPDGGTIEIRDGLGKPRSELLQDVSDQVNEQVNKGIFSQEDIKALSDFLAYCPMQGLFTCCMKGNAVNHQLHIEGDGKPKIDVKYLKEGKTQLEVTTKGECQQNSNIPIDGENFLTVPTTNATLTFEYNSKLSECKAKAASVTVNSFEQSLSKPIKESEYCQKQSLQRLKYNQLFLTSHLKYWTNDSDFSEKNISLFVQNPDLLSNLTINQLNNLVNVLKKESEHKTKLKEIIENRKKQRDQVKLNILNDSNAVNSITSLGLLNDIEKVINDLDKEVKQKLDSLIAAKKKELKPNDS